MKLLLHPAHRRFIKILRDKIKTDGYFILTNHDVESFLKITRQTKVAYTRHKAIYRIILRAINRPLPNNMNDTDRIINSNSVDYIESIFCKIERKQPFITLRNVILHPLILYVIKLLKRFSSICSTN